MFKIKTKVKLKPGFTLIELLVVVAIIGILAGVVLVAVNSARARSRDAKRMADLKQLASALELYFLTNSTYPTLNMAVDAYERLEIALAGSFEFTPTYMPMVPIAPIPSDGDCVPYGLPGSSNDYLYAGTGGPDISPYYTITFCLGKGTSGFEPGLHTMTQSGIY